MRITNKVTLLRLAFEGLLQRQPLHREHVEALYEFQDEIADYLKRNLPDHHQIYGAGVIAEMKDITEHIFKDAQSPRKSDLSECLGRLSLTANFVPKDKQNI
jgi:hypothetical protein